MERKFVDRPNWNRILERRFKLSYVENDDFEGVCISYLSGQSQRAAHCRSWRATITHSRQ
ncbi:hypothetical protein [Brassicibacter mesophilus]|uniref:hypothetical protein n=1 Tax=Brassicibacter mesophilus TaxID=745119 RepID=UPI003D23CFBE